MIFHKLFFLSENYFIDEEIYFKRYNYPNYNEHKGSHKGFLEKIAIKKKVRLIFTVLAANFFIRFSLSLIVDFY